MPVTGERGLIINEVGGERVLVISDVHIGFEEELLMSGIYIPNQTAEMLGRVLRIIREHRIDRLVINGDLKHRVPKTGWGERKKKLDILDRKGMKRKEEIEQRIREITENITAAQAGERQKLQREFEELEKEKNAFYRERREKRLNILEKSELELRNVATFLRNLIDLVSVDVIPGNHDGRIKKELEAVFPTLASDSRLSFHSVEGIVVGNMGIFHGHAWPGPEVMAQDFIVMGHGHAAILLTDSLGVRSYEHCWLRAPLTEKVHERYPGSHGVVILMPSFNDFFRGTPVNRKGRLLGPLFRNGYVDVERGSVHLLDGVNLGQVGVLRQFASPMGWR